MKTIHRATRRGIIASGIAAALSLTLSPAARAAPGGESAWPTRPITIIVPNPAGSATDTLARMVAEGLSTELKQPVVVDDKPGAQGIIGVRAMKARKPDGYTLIISFSGLNSSNPWLFKERKYDYRDDFTHIVPLVRAPLLLVVNADSPYKTLPDLLKVARADAGKVMYGYGQTTSQVMGGAFCHAGGFPAVRGIPYQGQPQALTDLIGGRFDFMFADLSVSLPFVKSGKLRALGISTQTRSDVLPDAPTLEEQGLSGYNLAAWVGLSGPHGMPREIVDRINTVVLQYFDMPATLERVKYLGFSPLRGTPQQFATFVDDEYVRWGRAISDAGIKPQ